MILRNKQDLTLALAWGRPYNWVVVFTIASAMTVLYHHPHFIIIYLHIELIPSRGCQATNSPTIPPSSTPKKLQIPEISGMIYCITFDWSCSSFRVMITLTEYRFIQWFVWYYINSHPGSTGRCNASLSVEIQKYYAVLSLSQLTSQNAQLDLQCV